MKKLKIKFSRFSKSEVSHTKKEKTYNEVNSCVSILSLFVLSVLFGLVALPQVYNANGLHLLLPDDVMITVRSAKMFVLEGIPSFNRTDLAQAASSYLLPILWYPFFKFFKDDTAIIFVSLFGASMYLLSIIKAFGKTTIKSNYILLIAVVLCSSTLHYVFTGWEHLHQSFFLVYSVFYFMRDSRSIFQNILFGLCAALSVLMRADSIFILLPILLFDFVNLGYKKTWIQFVVFGAIGALYTYIQLKWFGSLTPTTFKLKAGDSLPLTESLSFLGKNSLNGTSLSLVLILSIFLLGNLRSLSSRIRVVLIGLFLNVIFCVKMTDVFPYTRMMLPALIVVIFLVQYSGLKLSIRTKYVIGLSLFFGLTSINIKNFKSSINPGLSPQAEQILLKPYVEALTSPHDGAIGFCWLGVSANYTEYEAADFLGKADEDIASGGIKWGPTGHNKWDVNKTLEKWNPSVVFMPKSKVLASRSERLRDLDEKRDFAFWSEISLILEENGYKYVHPEKSFNYGFYLRSDLIAKSELDLH